MKETEKKEKKRKKGKGIKARRNTCQKEEK